MKKALNVEVTTDISDSTNEAIKNTLSHPTREFGTAVGTVIGFFNNTILYPMRKYNMYAEEKLNRFGEELKNKSMSIPDEKLVEPSINILGSAMEGLKYNLDEEHIKDMFLNILISDMDKDKKSDVLPSFIEIVKQLNNKDAKFLKITKQLFDVYHRTGFALLEVRLEKDNGGYISLDKYLVDCEEDVIKTIKLDQVVLDNLIRLGLIACVEDKWLVDEKIYAKGFGHVKNVYADIPNDLGIVVFDKGLIKITDFGLKFLNVCI